MGPPRFFTFFLSQLSSESMLIPSSFYDDLPLILPPTVSLQNSGGTWNVAMMNTREEVYLGQGWGKFAEDNSLSDGEFMTFVYDGERVFEVSIYGRDGCKETRGVTDVVEIDDKEKSVCSLSSNTSSDSESIDTITVPRSNNKGKEKEDVDESSDEDSDSDYLEAFGSMEVEESSNSDSSYLPVCEITSACVQPKVSTRINKGKSRMIQDLNAIDDGSFSDVEAIGNGSSSAAKKRESRKSRMIQDLNATDDGSFSDVEAIGDGSSSAAKKRETITRIIKNPETYLDNPENIHFETAVKKRPYELLIGSQMVKDYGLKFEDNIDYIDEKGKLSTKTVTWKDKRVCVKNWAYILRRNKLERSDRVVCELLRNGKTVHAIKIHVIRGKDL